MLTGSHHNSIDAKYRMVIPAKFREVLGSKCVLTKSADECLQLLSIEQWQELEYKLKKLPTGSNRNARRFQRLFTEFVTELEIDKQGRITLPQLHREFAGIEKDIIVVGCFDRIEVWGKERKEAFEDEAPSLEELESEMVQYGI